MSHLMADRKRVALLIRREGNYSQAILRGIQRYVVTVGGWHCEGADPLPTSLKALSGWQPDGILGGFFDQSAAILAAKIGCPVVDTFGWFAEPTFPIALCGDSIIGAMAAEHLLDRGFRTFAYAAYEWWPYSRRRSEAFFAAVKAAGDYPFFRYDQGPRSRWAQTAWAAADDHLRGWVKKLPKPIGVMATNDHWGVRLIEACRLENIRVPEDVAILGVDDDRLLCGFVSPPLTSIDTGSERVGYAAAKMLDEMMNRKTGLVVAASPEAQLIEWVSPIGVVTRQSTDVLAITDPVLAEALRYIRENATLRHRDGRKIDVTSVANHVAVPRRRLERRFHALLGRGPHQEIQRVRVNAAIEMLVRTDLAMPAIAKRSGFSSHGRFLKVFRQATGQTPSAYRLKFRNV